VAPAAGLAEQSLIGNRVEINLPAVAARRGSKSMSNAAERHGQDGANVVKTDIACSNGVIHLIDGVVLPK
jgi:uncharacterized surface protein with fasciclin (FAS1) repeats